MPESPEIINDPSAMRERVATWKLEKKTVGLVPTMGALHEGHLSLMKAASAECSTVAVSIFVNPTQFSPEEDLEKYPRTLEDDLAKLAELKVDVAFIPTADSIYPEGFSTFVEPPALSKLLEGEKRPNHFRGVTTVVAKLFNIIPADLAYFGQKDYQQALVIKRMNEDLNFGVNIRVMPIVREPDSLAMSSRNVYLDEKQREQSLAIYGSLNHAEQLIDSGERCGNTIMEAMEVFLRKAGIESIDYCVLSDRETLQPLTRLDRPGVLLVAAFVGSTRLIDNQLVDIE